MPSCFLSEIKSSARNVEVYVLHYSIDVKQLVAAWKTLDTRKPIR